MISSRSASDPDPSSISARPAVACGAKTWTSPSPRPAQNDSTSPVTSVTCRSPVSTPSSRDSIALTPPATRRRPGGGEGRQVLRRAHDAVPGKRGIDLPGAGGEINAAHRLCAPQEQLALAATEPVQDERTAADAETHATAGTVLDHHAEA